MASVRGKAVRWVSDEPQPGWVEVELTDASGTVHSLFDKPPVFVSDDVALLPDSPYPVPVDIDCTVRGEPGGSAVEVSLRWASTSDGRLDFVVRRTDVTF